MTYGRYTVEWSLVERTTSYEEVWANSQEEAEAEVRENIHILASHQPAFLEDMEVEMKEFQTEDEIYGEE